MKRIFAILFLTCTLGFTTWAKHVEGRVHYNSRMISGAIVTDGEVFARTGTEGTFRLEVKDNTKYIYVIAPPGFTSPYPDGFPQFWQEAEGRRWFNFELQPTSPSADYTLFSFPSVQISDSEALETFQNEVLPDIIDRTITARIDGLTAGVAITGEVAQGCLPKFKKLLAKAKIPLYLTEGEGPSNKAFFIGKDLVICTKDNGAESQAFIDRLLSMIPEGTEVILPETILREYHGAPRGYKVFTKRAGTMQWVFRSVDKGDDYQAEISVPGQVRQHPNELTANIWDFDSHWKVAWYQDGLPMGPMSQCDGHTFVATPSRYAKTVSVTVESRFGKKWTFDKPLQGTDVQAHLKFRDKTVQAFENEAIEAVSAGVNTLEMGLQLTAKGQVVAIRDSYPKFTQENGVDIGALIDKIEDYTKHTGRSPVRFTFAINSGSGAGEGKLWPEYKFFADKCLDLLLSKNLGDRLIIESFDDRVLNYIHRTHPEVELCYLVDSECGSFRSFMSLLDFTPRWIGLQYEIVDDSLVMMAREAGMRIAVWDVSSSEYIANLLNTNIDSIITENPGAALSKTMAELGLVLK